MTVKHYGHFHGLLKMQEILLLVGQKLNANTKPRNIYVVVEKFIYTYIIYIFY